MSETTSLGQHADITYWYTKYGDEVFKDLETMEFKEVDEKYLKRKLEEIEKEESKQKD